MGPGYGPGREDEPGPPGRTCEPAYDELDLLRGKAAGHRWDGWRHLTDDEAYFAACSCGWRSTEMGCVSLCVPESRPRL